MNIGKSIRVALARENKKVSWLAGEVGVTRQWISAVSNSKTASTMTVIRISNALKMKPSEFIALGED